MRTCDVTSWDDANVHVVRVTGEFDMAACSTFRRARAFDESELVVVDLRSTTFLDSHAMGELISLQRETSRTGTHYAILRPEGAADRIFKLTGMDTHLPLYDERVPVLAQFNFG